MDEQGANLLTRVHDWMLRRRLIREPQWGQPGLVHRLLRMRVFSATVLSLPAIVLCVWYGLMALMAHVSHQEELRVHEPLTLPLFQLHLHDRLMRDWRRFVMPEPRRDSPLPSYGLALASEELDKLDKHLSPDDGLSYYVDGLLIRSSRAHEIAVRYRGGKYWHPRHPQKSWKIRVKQGKFVDGFETFNFVNSAEALPFEEDTILEIAREEGLLTPEYFPFRLLLNKSYMGVYFFEAQPGGDLLRRARRAAGSVYSGSEAPVDPVTGVNTLFNSADHFTKVSQGLHQQLGDRQDLEGLIAAINQDSPNEFADYVDKHLDLDKFALFDALDVVFGCNQHDYADNHKFYYDPYRARFEPIAWNFRGCRHEHEFNRTENPLLLRLKQLPGYLARRNRAAYRLLQGASSPESLRERTRRFLDTLQADQARDPYWDAHQLLPPISPYYSQLLRPLNRQLQDITSETRLHELRKRNRFLTRAIERPSSAVIFAGSGLAREEQSASASPAHVAALDVSVGGESGCRLRRVEPGWEPGCTPGSWEIYADTSLDDRFEPARDRLITTHSEKGVARLPLEFYTGVRFDSRPTQANRGRIRAVTEARRYRLYVQSASCQLTGVALHVEDLATGHASLILTPNDSVSVASAPAISCEQRYRLQPGYSSPHPWCRPTANQEVVYFGPGVVQIGQTRVFDSNQRVVISPGTTFSMSPNASLVFRGKLEAKGTVASPIRFEASGESWGGIVLQGPDTQGSQLSYVAIGQGTYPKGVGEQWPGTLNIHDTADISLAHCQVHESAGDAAIHVASTQGLQLLDSNIRNTTGDGLALKYSTATLESLTVVNAGRDAVSLVGADARLAKARVVLAKGAGISLNQLATLSVQDSFVARAMRGLYVHEGATLEHARVLLYDHKVGVRFEPSDDGFPTKARIKGDVLYAVSCQTPIETESKRRKPQARVISELARAELEAVRTQVLHLSNWDALNPSIAGLLDGVEP